MNLKLKTGKKTIALLFALILTVGLGSAASAATFGNAKNGASNVEVLQVRYDGAAWNYKGSGYNWASFKYTRDGRTLLTKTAYRLFLEKF
ncbi:hypothetical protein [Caldifermentibacillus hisashii]|uniref:hypothetical protein n=1 Tax=Caldifermentibacillus hisashii TaxID=996558 RepID=UPI003134C820